VEYKSCQGVQVALGEENMLCGANTDYTLRGIQVTLHGSTPPVGNIINLPSDVHDVF
jgi:hypothetical protein